MHTSTCLRIRPLTAGASAWPLVGADIHLKAYLAWSGSGPEASVDLRPTPSNQNVFPIVHDYGILQGFHSRTSASSAVSYSLHLEWPLHLKSKIPTRIQSLGL